MTFHSRDITAQRKRKNTSHLWFDLIVILGGSGIGGIHAGQFTTTDFTHFLDTNHVLIFTNSMKIAPRETINVPLLEDCKLTTASGNYSYTPDVVCLPDDTFCFFWAEYNGSTHSVYRQEMYLVDTGAVKENVVPVFVNASVGNPYTFLHAERSVRSGYFVTTFGRETTVVAATDIDTAEFISKPNNALSYLANDTFCIVSKKDNNKLIMRNVWVNSNNRLSFVSDTYYTVKENTNGVAGNLSNVSIAGDSSGFVMIMLTRGTGLSATKMLYYKLSNSGNVLYDSGFVDSCISLNKKGSIDYADAPVVSYADKKFASVYWKKEGIYLVDLAVTGTAVSGKSITQVVAATLPECEIRAPTVATNGKYLLIAWRNYLTKQILGKRLQIVNGSLLAIPAQTIVLSDPATSVDTAGPELNAVISSRRSIAVTGKYGNDAYAALWAERAVLFPAASWYSAVYPVTAKTGDSIVYTAGSVDTSLQKGTITAYLKVGPSQDTGNSGWSSSWLSLGSASQLVQNTKSASFYFRFRVDFTRNNADSITTPTISRIGVRWNMKPVIGSMDSGAVNGIKQAGFTGFNDTLDIVSHTDTVDCYFAAYDGDTSSDTVYISVPWSVSPLLARDTIYGGGTRHGSIRLMPTVVWDTVYNCVFSGTDAAGWNAQQKGFTIRVRKEAPVIPKVTFDGVQKDDGAPVPVVLGKATTVNVSLDRPKIVEWNRITYRFKTHRFDTSFSTDSQLVFRPAQTDTHMQIFATDMFEGADTVNFLFTYPKYTVDTVWNPGYAAARRKLSDSLSFIIGGKDTTKLIALPCRNTGNVSLRIDSLFFKGNLKKWFRLGIVRNDTIVYYDSLTTGAQINPVVIQPESTSTLYFLINAKNCTGDSIVRDTVYLWTNDPILRADTIPVRMTHIDLPVLKSCAVQFDPGTPYWVDQRRRIKNGYVFPPHARLVLTFSEPMDSASAKRGIFTYSIFESGITGKIDTMYFEQKWKNNHTTLVLRPEWNKSSVYFKGLKPPQRMYIPTDSIAVRITARLRDQAKPPLGPNALDIHKTFIPDSTGDTTYTYRIDSIHFTIDSVFPDNKKTGVEPRPRIALTFSSPIYPGTVDTAKYNNKSLLVTTKYNSKLDSARRVIFDSVFISANKIFFVPKKSFFFGDSVYCYYRGVSARDTLGFSIDMNNDGIPKHFFDSSSREDDYSWSFLIQEITNSGVIPDSGSVGVSMKTPISLQFTRPIYPGTIDTARVKNRSLTVTSTYSEGTPILYDSVVINGNKAAFYLNHTLFYADSVFCNFRGLITKDTAGFSIDIGNDTDLTNNKGKKWFFKVEELKVTSVFPDSGNRKATIRTPISLTFSGPVSPLIFDTSLVADCNRSFYGTSSYNGARRILFSGLQFSPDSTTITLYPAKVFYSYDSVTCFFAGYRRGYSYLNIQSLVPIDSQSTVGKYTWYFLTGNEGFYTYPNPFKPGSDPRHRNLGGIWFKNLHALANQRGALSTVMIRIYTMNTHRVVESGPVNFQDGNPEKKPEWFWNTTNGRGAPVSTGVYFYGIYDTQNKMLLKGKILIVR